MKNSVKSKILIVLSFVFAFAMCMCALTTFSAKAAPATFAMHTGASIRVGAGTEEDPIGIRFIATIDSDEYNGLISDYGAENVQFGMRVARCETVEELMRFPDESSMHPVTTVVENAEAGLHVISIAIRNVSAAQYNSYFTALAYVQLTDATSQTTKVIYADYVEGENSRTPFQVAAAHKLLSGMTEDDLEAEYINGILDNVLAQGGMFTDKSEYVLAANASVVPTVEIAGVPVQAELTVAKESVAKIEDGAIVAVGAGSTTLTATVTGGEKTLTKTATVTVKDSALALNYANGAVEWSGEATAVVVDGTEISVTADQTKFEVAEYLKKNGYEEKAYSVTVKNESATSEAVTITMKNVDNAEELLAISSGDANTYYVVTDNISLAESSVIEVVESDVTYKAYIESLSGVLDVNGYAIYALNYTETEDVRSRYKGLIFKVNESGVIKNGYFTGAISAKDNANAFIVGDLEGIIDNCYLNVKKFGISYPTTNSGSEHYYTAQGIIFDARDTGRISNLIVNMNGLHQYLPIVDYANGAKIENVITLSSNYSVKTSGLDYYRLVGANSYIYTAFDKNNTYVYADEAALFANSGSILKYDGTAWVMSTTAKVPYLDFASVFAFDGEAGKIYMVNDKYGKMDMNVSVNIAQEELDVVKEKYSPQISVSLSGIYGDDAVTYESSKTSVVTVDDSGVVTYVADGTATITVTHTESGATATVPVTAYGEYIGITDITTFKSIDGKTQYVYAELLNDIDISLEDFSSYVNYSVNIYQNLGTFSSTALIETFSGTLNGNGKKLSVIMDVSEQTYEGSLSGLFNYITATGVVKNLIYTFEITAKTQVQAFANAHAGIIKDCYFDGVITTTSKTNYLINVERNTAQLNNNIYNLRLNYQGTEDTYWFRLLRIASTYQSKYTSINNAMFITSNPENYFYASQSSNNTTCYKTATNVSAYASFADILTGNGYSITLDETDTTYKTYLYTALTAPQYSSFGPAWSFTESGISLCGTAIYTAE